MIVPLPAGRMYPLPGTQRNPSLDEQGPVNDICSCKDGRCHSQIPCTTPERMKHCFHNDHRADGTRREDDYEIVSEYLVLQRNGREQEQQTPRSQEEDQPERAANISAVFLQLHGDRNIHGDKHRRRKGEKHKRAAPRKYDVLCRRKGLQHPLREELNMISDVPPEEARRIRMFRRKPEQRDPHRLAGHIDCEDNRVQPDATEKRAESGHDGGTMILHQDREAQTPASEHSLCSRAPLPTKKRKHAPGCAGTLQYTPARTRLPLCHICPRATSGDRDVCSLPRRR